MRYLVPRLCNSCRTARALCYRGTHEFHVPVVVRGLQCKCLQCLTLKKKLNIWASNLEIIEGVRINVAGEQVEGPGNAIHSVSSVVRRDFISGFNSFCKVSFVTRFGIPSFFNFFRSIFLLFPLRNDFVTLVRLGLSVVIETLSPKTVKSFWVTLEPLWFA